jgi:hypothetical protein
LLPKGITSKRDYFQKGLLPERLPSKRNASIEDYFQKGLLPLKITSKRDYFAKGLFPLKIPSKRDYFRHPRENVAFFGCHENPSKCPVCVLQFGLNAVQLARDGADDTIKVKGFPSSPHNLEIAFRDQQNVPHKRAPLALVQQRDLIYIPDCPGSAARL